MRSRNMEPFIRRAAISALVLNAEASRQWAAIAAMHDTNNPGLVPTAKQRAKRDLLGWKTRALIRHDRILRGEV